MSSPSRKRLKVKVRLSASVAAASWVAPRRPISRTSVAWIACCVTLARISGQASASVARSSSRHATARSPGENVPAASIETSLRARSGEAIQTKRFGRAHWSSASAEQTANSRGPAMKFVRAIWKLLVGIKDALVLLIMLLFFAMLYAGLSVRPAPVKDGVLDLDLKGSVVEQPARRRMVGHRRRRAPAAISPARPHRRARRRQRTTTGSRQSRSTSTASPAADRRRSATLPTQSAGSARRASRSSPMRPATPTTATSLPLPHRKSG